MNEFLKRSGYSDYDVEPLSADAGLRSYSLLTHGNDRKLFMDMSASDYESGFRSYLKVRNYLFDLGIRVPEIYEHDVEEGLSVIEDLGQKSFGDARNDGVDLYGLYEKATDVLIAIREGAKGENTLNLGPYDQTRIRDRLEQFVEYYMPAVTGNKATAEDHESFQALQQRLEEGLPECPKGLCHADYHLENLIWMPDEPQGYGLIDFQDAFWGPLPYDLLNLLEDARQTVPKDIKAAMKDRYCANMNAKEREAFDAWYVYLSSHFHCRVIGLFVMLKQERGMGEYLVHIPRLQGYICEHLKNPVLAPLKEWVEERDISLTSSPNV